MAAGSTLLVVTTVPLSVAATSFAVALRSDGGEAVPAGMPASPGATPTDSDALRGDVGSPGQLCGSHAWLAAEPCSRVSMLLLLLLLGRSSGGCVLTFAFSVPGGGFTVQESWSNSVSGWTLMAEAAFSWLSSLAPWWPEDCARTSLPTADCQLSEQRTAGMLQGQRTRQAMIRELPQKQGRNLETEFHSALNQPPYTPGQVSLKLLSLLVALVKVTGLSLHKVTEDLHVVALHFREISVTVQGRFAHTLILMYEELGFDFWNVLKY